MDQSQRFRNFFSSVSHITIKPSCPEETIKELAIAAKSVENRIGIVGNDYQAVNSYQIQK